MRTRLITVISAAALLFGSMSGVASAMVPATPPVTVAPVTVKNPGSSVTISGTTTFPQVIIKVMNAAKVIVYYDVVDADVSGAYSKTFQLPTDAAEGIYNIVVGKSTDVSVQTFEVKAATTTDPGGGLPGGGLPGGIPGGTPGGTPGDNTGEPPVDTTGPITDADPTTGNKFEFSIPTGTVTQNVEQTSNGTLVKAVIDEKKLTDFINKNIGNVLNPENKQKVVVVEVTGQADTVQTGLLVNTFKTLESRDTSAAVEIKSTLGSILIPAQAISEQAQALGLQGEAPVSVIVSKVNAQTEQTINDSIQSVGAETLVTPIDFRIEATAQGKTVELNNFDSYIEHTLSLPSTTKDVNVKHMAGVMVDPSTGSYYPMPTWFTKKTDGDVDGTILRKGNSVYTIVKNVKTFSDIEKSYAKETIETLASKFIVGGYGDGTFLPAKRVTRAEFATLLIRSLGILPEQTATATFSDVESDDWYAGAVSAAVKAGLIAGYEDNTFRPNREVTRQEMVQMIYNSMKMAGYDKPVTAVEKENLLSKFADVESVPAWAAEAVAVATREQVVSGMEDSTFAPTGKADRAQGATVLYRMMKALRFIN